MHILINDRSLRSCNGTDRKNASEKEPLFVRIHNNIDLSSGFEMCTHRKIIDLALDPFPFWYTPDVALAKSHSYTANVPSSFEKAIACIPILQIRRPYYCMPGRYVISLANA